MKRYADARQLREEQRKYEEKVAAAQAMASASVLSDRPRQGLFSRFLSVLHLSGRQIRGGSAGLAATRG
jgi:hypothetical protein